MRSDVIKKGAPAAPNRSLLYALGMDCVNQGMPLNFGLARGVGAGSYALASTLCGSAAAAFGPKCIPVLLGGATLLLLAAALSFRPGTPAKQAAPPPASPPQRLYLGHIGLPRRPALSPATEWQILAGTPRRPATKEPAAANRKGISTSRDAPPLPCVFAASHEVGFRASRRKYHDAQ